MKTGILAVTMGDPAGIGPEIVAKAFCSDEVADRLRCVVIGDLASMERAVAKTRADVTIKVITSPEQGDYRKGVMNLIDMGIADTAHLEMRKPSARCGAAAYAYIAKSVELAKQGEILAVATAPICKESLKLAGVDFIGHTEIYGGLTETPDPLTMFEVNKLRIFFLTRHISLLEACKQVGEDRLVDYAVRSIGCLERIGLGEGTMAIAGLNPHNGEWGGFGREEIESIAPAVQRLQAMGYAVKGPIAADSVFHQALQGAYCAVLSLYHDQGHIAAKTYDFERTISLTLELPFLRTSVDHGTAFDIAGDGSANEISMIEAIRLAGIYGPIYGNDYIGKGG